MTLLPLTDETHRHSCAAGHATFDMLRWMDDDLRAAFAAAVHRRSYAAGQSIYMMGESGHEMFRIVAGSVRLSVMHPDGRETIFMLFEPGDCFGDSSLVDGGPRPQTAEALTAVQVDCLGDVAFATLRAGYRAFDDALLKLLSTQMRVVSQRYTDSSMSSLQVRVAARLVEAVRSFGDEVEGGTRLSMRLPQSEIASMVGATRQSVNKVLRRFQAEGLVTIEYGNVLVRDLPKLAKVSE